MRMIDADALVEEIVKIDDLRKLSTATIGKALDAVSTIDAIPVEWMIEKELDLKNKDAALSRAAWLVLHAWWKEQEAQDG